MPKVETKDYNGDNRRNGGKLKLSFRDYFSIVALIVSLVFGGAVAWATLNYKVSALAEEVKRVDSNKDSITKNEKAIIKIDGKLENIEEKTSNIQLAVKEQKVLLEKILYKIQ